MLTIAGEANAMVDSMKAAFQTCATDSIAAIGAIAPIALSIFVCIFLWKKGKQFFSAMGK
ncbi:hypothetical protein RBG61_01395 [Paludicola sp. MB14-C6]|uniref:hypothetical protein n=1 Tax=Paludihabitans sp. MB14-C6 TaxID=3070656 RepID=UPI0027DD1D29|nr:hypothetical protein [Paludicola sp. MB14-C6]WMJ23344.1 hypothetical protein RBG61_01395 [Paludicola sp. MB14-C6]